MMKQKLTYLLLAAALLTTACQDNKDEAPDPARAYPAVLVGKAYAYDASGVGSSWSKGETIGVYMLEAGTDRIVAPYSNIRYYANERTDQDYFLPGSNDSILYYPPTGVPVEVVAYYPRTETRADSLVAVNVINQKYVSAASLLYSRVSGLNKDQRKVRFNLSPVLTMLSFKFTVGTGVTDAHLKGLNVVLRGVPSSGYFNAVRGTFSLNDVYVDIPLITQPATAPATRAVAAAETSINVTGLVMPAPAVAGYQVHVNLPALDGGKVFVYEMKQDINNLAGATHYVFDSRVNRDGLDVKVQYSPIINWGDGGGIGGDGTEIP